MNIVFKKIKLNNFFSFKYAELDLSEMGNTLVTGRNNCKLDNAYSNGSGKSSIFNGICYALTGETAQGITNGIENIFGDPNNCWVELTFLLDGDEFIIRRYKTPKPDLKVFVNGEDHSGKGIRESSKILANYMPDLTSELVGSVIVLGQGMPHRFSDNNPAGRKEILEKLTKSDFMIQSIKDKLDLRITELKEQLRVKEDSSVANKSQISVYTKQLESYNADLLAYNNSNVEEDISKLKSDIEAYKNESEVCNTELSIVSDDISKHNTKKAELLSNSNAELNEKLADIDSKIKEANSTITEVLADKKALEKEIKKLDAITDICPTCGQKIPEVNKPDTTQQKENLATLTKDYNDLKANINDYNSERDSIITNHNKLYSDEISEIDNNIKELQVKEKGLKAKLNQQSENINSCTQKLYKLETLKDNYNKLLTNIKETNSVINDIQAREDKLEIEITEFTTRIGIVQHMITLAKKEFRGVLLSSIIEFTNKKVKQYSKEVFGTEALSFTLNENCIDITYCDKMYENLSGGEKQKIDVIVQLALRDILSKQLGTRFNLLICDEIYDNMDTIGCQKITNLISNLTDIDSIFIISHHAQDLEITYDNQLQVVKSEEGVSSLNFV